MYSDFLLRTLSFSSHKTVRLNHTPLQKKTQFPETSWCEHAQILPLLLWQEMLPLGLSLILTLCDNVCIFYIQTELKELWQEIDLESFWGFIALQNVSIEMT